MDYLAVDRQATMLCRGKQKVLGGYRRGTCPGPGGGKFEQAFKNDRMRLEERISCSQRKAECSRQRKQHSQGPECQ